MSGIRFEKEDIDKPEARQSLLGASLASSSASGVRIAPPLPVGLVEVQEVVAPELAIGSLGPTGPPGAAAAASSSSVLGFRVDQVIKAVLRATTSSKLATVPGFPLRQNHKTYSLRLAGDDGVQVDTDFPEIDFDVQLTSVGAEKFILTEADSGAPVVRLSVPSDSLQLRVCELGAVDELPVSCILVPSAGATEGATAGADGSRVSATTPSGRGAGATPDPGRRGSIRRGAIQFQVKMRSPEGKARAQAGGAGGALGAGLAATPAVAVTFGGARSLAWELAQSGQSSAADGGGGGGGEAGRGSGTTSTLGGVPGGSAAGAEELEARVEGKRADSSGATSWGSEGAGEGETKAGESPGTAGEAAPVASSSGTEVPSTAADPGGAGREV